MLDSHYYPYHLPRSVLRSDRVTAEAAAAVRRIDLSSAVNPYNTVGDLVSKETVCCVDGKVKHLSKLSTTRSVR